MDIKEVKKILSSKGISITNQRLKMADLLLEQNKHITADEMIQLLRAESPDRISRATVFNNLNVFAQNGIIKKLELKTDNTVYDSNTKPHHHLLDTNEGKIMDIELKHESAIHSHIKKQIEDRYQIQFDIQEMHITIKATIKN